MNRLSKGLPLSELGFIKIWTALTVENNDGDTLNREQLEKDLYKVEKDSDKNDLKTYINGKISGYIDNKDGEVSYIYNNPAYYSDINVFNIVFTLILITLIFLMILFL